MYDPLATWMFLFLHLGFYMLYSPHPKSSVLLKSTQPYYQELFLQTGNMWEIDFCQVTNLKQEYWTKEPVVQLSSNTSIWWHICPSSHSPSVKPTQQVHRKRRWRGQLKEPPDLTGTKRERKRGSRALTTRREPEGELQKHNRGN